MVDSQQQQLTDTSESHFLTMQQISKEPDLCPLQEQARISASASWGLYCHCLSTGSTIGSEF